jgi:DNA repair exonuclease SbcCD ATPase subunit
MAAHDWLQQQQLTAEDLVSDADWPEEKQHQQQQITTADGTLAAVNSLEHRLQQSLSQLEQLNKEKSSLEQQLQECLEQLGDVEEERSSLEQRLEQALEEKCELEELENDSRLREEILHTYSTLFTIWKTLLSILSKDGHDFNAKRVVIGRLQFA